jgi:outer membrane immunogenic protein
MLRVFSRTLVSVSALLLAGSLVHAADLDGSFLRGDVSTDGGSVWDGTYVGATFGHTTLDGIAAGAGKDAVKNYLRGTATLVDLKPDDLVNGFSDRDQAWSYGGVVGHNWSWDGVIFGVEGSYQRSDLKIEGVESTRHVYKATGDTNSAGLKEYENFQARYGGYIKITDMAALKGRIGYDAGPFMPFLTAGVAVIRGDSNYYVSIASGNTFGSPAVTFPATPQFNKTKKGIYGFGMTGGVGVDYMISDGFILRGEYEITRISSFDGAVQDFQTFKTTLAAKF